MRVWLVGAGPMAAFHAAVLAALPHETTIIATSPVRAQPLAEAHGMISFHGGLTEALKVLPLPDCAVVALPIDLLATAGEQLIRAGVRRVLLEKPAAISVPAMEALCRCAADSDAYLGIAYNRRFLASVERAREIIAQEGPVLSFSFDFTENAPRVAELTTPDEIKARWLLANSTHVIDLAFHLCGWPDQAQYSTQGALAWHPSAAFFQGNGTTQSGAHFSYMSDWRGPGRWGMEIVLPHKRLFLRPIEELSVMQSGRFDLQKVDIDSDLDIRFKPGLFQMLSGFLDITPDPRITTGAEQLDAMKNIYSSMGNYC